jgi:hypothetical protein
VTAACSASAFCWSRTPDWMGKAAWWLPAWFDRLLPHVDIEGGGQAEGGGDDRPPAPPGPILTVPVAH